MADSYDLVVIGAGPGGYVAAIRAAQLGMKVVCVEKRASLGGTCLNIGCIPSKALLSSSEKFAEAQNHFKEIGVEVGSVKLNLKQMMANKASVVEQLTSGVAFLFKKNKIDWKTGTAVVKSATEVEVTGAKGKKEVLKTERVLIATGSEPTPLPRLEIDEKKIVTSTGALELTKLPGHLVVIGGGVIGLEMASVWARLGSKVTVVEFLDRILPGMDSEIAKKFPRMLQKQGISFKMGTKVTAAKKTKSGVVLTAEPAKGGDSEAIEADIVLVAIGRRPFTEGLGLEKVGVQMDQRGFITVDADFETNIPGIFAVGDVIHGPMLAHKAEEDGVAAVETMAGQSGHVDYNLVPSIVYTWPEVASVGKTDEQLKEAGVEYKTGSFPFSANPRAKSTGFTEGFVKILADKKTDAVLGAHIVGPAAGDLIHEVAAVMAFGGSSDDIGRICHGHPTLSEAVKEAGLAASTGAIHI